MPFLSVGPDVCRDIGAASAREWWLVLSKRKAPAVNEAVYVASAYATGD